MATHITWPQNFNSYLVFLIRFTNGTKLGFADKYFVCTGFMASIKACLFGISLNLTNRRGHLVRAQGVSGSVQLCACKLCKLACKF